MRAFLLAILLVLIGMRTTLSEANEVSAISVSPPYMSVIVGSVSPEKISLSEALYVFANQLVALNNSSPGFAPGVIENNLAVELNSGFFLYEKLSSMLNQHREYALRLSAAMCAHRETFTNSDLLAAALSHEESSSDSEWNRLVSILQMEIGSTVMDSLNSFLAENVRPSMTVTRIDFSKWLRHSNLPSQEVVNRKCVDPASLEDER